MGLNNPIQMWLVAGKYALSGNCSGVVGGTMTAGTADAYGSNVIYWTPAFISAPMVFAQAFSAAGTTATIMPVNVTGVTNCGCYVECYASGGSMSILCLGEARL